MTPYVPVLGDIVRIPDEPAEYAVIEVLPDNPEDAGGPAVRIEGGALRWWDDIEYVRPADEIVDDEQSSADTVTDESIVTSADVGSLTDLLGGAR